MDKKTLAMLFDMIEELVDDAESGTADEKADAIRAFAHRYTDSAASNLEEFLAWFD